MKTKIVTIPPTIGRPAFAFLMHQNGRPVCNRDGRIFSAGHTIESAIATLNRIWPVQVNETRKESSR